MQIIVPGVLDERWRSEAGVKTLCIEYDDERHAVSVMTVSWTRPRSTACCGGFTLWGGH